MGDQPEKPDQPEFDEPAAVDDLEPPEDQADDVKGGSVHNVLKTRHDTVKNSIGN